MFVYTHSYVLIVATYLYYFLETDNTFAGGLVGGIVGVIVGTIILAVALIAIYVLKKRYYQEDKNIEGIQYMCI